MTTTDDYGEKLNDTIKNRKINFEKAAPAAVNIFDFTDCFFSGLDIYDNTVYDATIEKSVIEEIVV